MVEVQIPEAPAAEKNASKVNAARRVPVALSKIASAVFTAWM